ncbi:hypothetical protein QZH41_010642, partial [Actinostola sp. cb2023]
NMSRDVLIAVREERTRIGNLDITKQTALIATDDGVIAYEVNTVQRQQPLPYRGYGSSALPGISRREPEMKSCCDYCCCECDSDFPWHDLQGK